MKVVRNPFVQSIFVVVLLLLAVIPPYNAAAQTAPSSFTVVGQVSSGTANIPLPAELELTLNVVSQSPSGELDIKTQATTILADNTYRFTDIAVAAGASVFVTTNYAGFTQGSPIARVQDGQSTLELPIILYAPTNDQSVVTLTRAQYILDFLPGGLMQVLATFYHRVSGDRFFVSNERSVQGTAISVAIPLPIGAQSIAFTNNINNRFTIGGTNIAPIIQDSRPIIPGLAHEIVVSYQLPYNKGAPIDQDYPFATEMIEVLIPVDAGVQLTGDFAANPNITINPQRTYTQYNLIAPLTAGARLIYTLDGVPPVQLATPVSAASTNRSGVDFLPLILGVIALVIVLALITAGILRPERRKQ